MGRKGRQRSPLHLAASDRFGEAARASEVTNFRNSVATGRDGPTDERRTYQSRAIGAGATVIVPSSPASSSVATAARDTKDTPRPARAACLIAPFDPRVIVCTSMPALAMNSSLTARVPEPGSRRSQRRPASLRGRHGLCARERVVGRGDQHELVGQDRVRLDPLLRRRAAADGQIRLVVSDDREDVVAVADLEREADLWVRRCECPHERRDERLGGGGDRRDRQGQRALASASRAACRPCSSRPMTSAA